MGMAYMRDVLYTKNGRWLAYSRLDMEMIHGVRAAKVERAKTRIKT